MAGEGEVLWRPSRDRIEGARITAFLRELRADGLEALDGYDALWRWSVDDPAAFWSRLWDWSGVVGEKGDAVVDDPDRMPGARWFGGARLNFAENLLRHGGDRPALIHYTEAGRQGSTSFDELRAQVAALAAWLREAGVGPGDVVAAYMPNHPATVVTMLAASSVGATFSSCSQDFGVRGALDRLGQVRPRVLVAADGYTYAGKARPAADKVAEICAGLGGSLERLLWVEQLGGAAAPGGVPTTAWVDALAAHAGAAPAYERLPFDHPLYILFSSGTTGLPKCIVHGQGGTLLQHSKELALHTDLREGERIFYYTTCGWMMWNWLVSSLALGATVVLWDGSPFAPADDALWGMAQEVGLNVFGTSAKYLAELEKRGVAPREGHSLPALRAVLSTGSTLLPESFDFVYRDIGSDLQLSSISGGTDIVSCFALGCPVLPVRRGELQARGLGMRVEVFDPDGRPVVGEKGELVCTRAFPSMPVGFGDDPDGAKYRAAYFERFEGVWHHGDYVELREHGGMVFYGRSDATLNPGGVRIGTAEIYRVVDAFEEVAESVVVGVEQGGDTVVALFVRCADGHALDEALERRLAGALREQASPHHVPRIVRAVDGIPRTASGKISEIAVRRALQGQELRNREALANPEALAAFEQLGEELGLRG